MIGETGEGGTEPQKTTEKNFWPLTIYLFSLRVRHTGRRRRRIILFCYRTSMIGDRGGGTEPQKTTEKKLWTSYYIWVSLRLRHTGRRRRRISFFCYRVHCTSMIEDKSEGMEPQKTTENKLWTSYYWCVFFMRETHREKKEENTTFFAIVQYK